MESWLTNPKDNGSSREIDKIAVDSVSETGRQPTHSMRYDCCVLVAEKQTDRPVNSARDEIGLLAVAQNALSEARSSLRSGDADAAEQYYAQALNAFSQVIDTDPTSAEAFLGRGLVFRESEQNTDKARDDFTKAISLAPQWVEPYHQRGEINITSRQFALAVDDFDTAIELDGANPDLYFGRGVALLLQNNNDAAIMSIDDLNKAISIAPQFADAYSTRGRAYALLGDFERATNDYEMALKIDPSNELAMRLKMRLEEHLRNLAEN